MKRVLIVEDIPETLRWLTEIASAAFPECSVKGVRRLSEARDAIRAEEFDLALIDLSLPDGSGLEIMRQIQSENRATLCVVTTVTGDDAHLVSALSAGAQGYLLKEYTAEQLARQLVQLADGVPALSPRIAHRIMQHFQMTGPMNAEDTALSEREKQTLALIARGLRNCDVACNLGIAESTVATHIKAIYRKLGISTRAEASWHATRLGL